MEINSLEDLFVEQLRDMYYAENKLIEALSDMADKATNPELRDAFLSHLDETKDQVSKLVQVMGSLDIEIKAEECEAIKGILKEAKELMGNTDDRQALDAALILAAQKVEHYEIATYGCLCAFAECLGFTSEAQILHSILDQEKNADSTLTSLAGGSSEVSWKEDPP